MSLLSCVVLLLLCLSLHACNGRRFAATEMKDIDDQKKFQVSNQGGHQKEISVTSKVESSPSSEPETTKDSNVNAETRLGDNSRKLIKGLKAKQKLTTNKKVSGSGSVAVPKESKASVSWRVPQHKGGEKHPGFNLDYSPPKTHPPSHN